ncbi:MAG: hypothetical protein ACI4NW_06720 [Stenotrophomonas sp.]
MRTSNRARESFALKQLPERAAARPGNSLSGLAFQYQQGIDAHVEPRQGVMR